LIWYKQVFIHTRLSRTYLALTRLSCANYQHVLSVCPRGAKVLENRITADEERIKLLEKELEMTIVFGEEADRKYEAVSNANHCYHCARHLLSVVTTVAQTGL